MDAVVVKVGGSLAAYPGKLRAICQTLGRISKTHKLVVLPGGGEFADTVRKIDSQFSLSSQTSHFMAILAMDQYGLLLSDLIPNAFRVDSLGKAAEALGLGRVPVFLPSQLLFDDGELENSWDVTSDSIAVYVAGKMGAGKVMLVTDVDGIFTADPKKYPQAKLIKKVFAKQLLTFDGRTSVDRSLPKFMLKYNIDCVVVNGLFPERIEAVLSGQFTLCTAISRS